MWKNKTFCLPLILFSQLGCSNLTQHQKVVRNSVGSNVILAGLPNSVSIESNSSARNSWLFKSITLTGSIHKLFDSKHDSQRTIAMPPGVKRVLAISNSNDELIADCGGGKVIAFSITSGKEIWSYQLPDKSPRILSTTESGKKILYRTGQSEVHISGVGFKKPRLILKADSRMPYGTLNSSGNVALIGIGDSLIGYSTETTKRIGAIRNLISQRIAIRCEWLNESEFVVYSDKGADVCRVSDAGIQIIQHFENAISVSPDRLKWVRFNSNSWSLEALGPKSSKPTTVWQIPLGALGDVRITASNQVLTSHEDGTIRIWEE
jgi:hypothetical protein